MEDQPQRVPQLVSNIFCLSETNETIKKSHKLLIDVECYDKSLNPNSNIKIIELRNCATVDAFLDTINETNFSNFVKYSTHCFMVIANIYKDESYGVKEMTKKLNKYAKDCVDRPLIIQVMIKRTEESKIFFKDSGDVEFNEVDETVNKGKKFDNLENFNFNIMLTSAFDGFQGDLSNLELNVNKIIEGKPLIELVIALDNALVMRFLKLFMPSTTDQKFLIMAVKQSGPQTIAALLDMPILDDRKELNLHPALKQQINSATGNLLAIAAESGKAETVDFLIRLNIWNQNFGDSLDATNAAMRGSNDENLLVLLENDFPFPKNVEKSQNKAIGKIIKDNNYLYEAIQKNDSNFVKSFIRDNPNKKNCFNSSNVTALRAALNNFRPKKTFNILPLLIYNGFTSFGDNEYQNIFQRMKDSIKEKITIACKKYYRTEVDSHVLFIYSKTRLGLGYNKEKQQIYFKKIKEFLEKLNAEEKIKPILKAIEHYHSLMIVFDFDRKNVSKIDLVSSESTLGSSYSTSGRIYIGANASDEEVLGILIHELTHFAMEIVFSNGGKPFYAGDNENRDSFEEIVSEIKNRSENNSIVGRVFSCYEENVHSAELIVRVPEMMAYYKNDDLDAELIRYKKLASFYTDKVLVEVENIVKDPNQFQATRDLQQLNDRLGNVKFISEIKLRKHAAEDVAESSGRQVVISEIPHFTIANVIRYMRSGKFSVINLKDLNNQPTVDFAISLCTVINDGTTIINLEDSTEIPKTLRKFFDLNCCSVIIVCENEKIARRIRTLMKINETLFNTTKLKYYLNDIEEDMQLELLQNKGKFQAYEIELCKILTDMSPELVKSLPVAEIYMKKLKPIGQPIQSSHSEKYFTQRLFRKIEKDGKPSEKVTTFDSFIQETKNQRLILIFGVAGMGKSTMLTHIAHVLKNQMPDHWIVRVDLHKHVEAYERKQLSTLNLLCDHFEKTNGSFEKNLMENRLTCGKVILMLDGLDEIAPYYNKYFNDLLEELKKSEVKQIWITTRPHATKIIISSEQQQNLNPEVFDFWQLDPFSIEDQKRVIIKYWENKLIDVKIQGDCLEKYATELLKFLKNSACDASDLMAIPLHSYMIAKVFLDEIKNNLMKGEPNFTIPKEFNVLWLYDNFMIQKTTITNNFKGKLVQNEIRAREESYIQIYREFGKMAIRSYFSYVFENKNVDQVFLSEKFYKLNPKISNDELQRRGIVSIDSNQKPNFCHRTYGEYFASKYIVYNFINSMEFNNELLIETLQLIIELIVTMFSTNILTFLDISLMKLFKSEPENMKILLTNFSNCIESRPSSFDLKILFNLSFTFVFKFLIECIGSCCQDLAKKVLFPDCTTMLELAVMNRNHSVVSSILELFDTKMKYLAKDYMCHKSNGMNALVLSFYLMPPSLESFRLEFLSSINCNAPIAYRIFSYKDHAPNCITSNIFNFTKKIFNKDEQKQLFNDIDNNSEIVLRSTSFENTILKSKDLLFRFQTQLHFLLEPIFDKDFFRFCLDDRWIILNEIFDCKNETELSQASSLFSNFIAIFLRQTLNSFYTPGVTDRDLMTLETFKWIHEKFQLNEIEKFVIQYFTFLLSILENTDQIATGIIEIVRLHSEPQNFLKLLLHMETLICEMPVHHLKTLLNVMANNLTQKELLNFMLNSRNNLNVNTFLSLLMSTDMNDDVFSIFLTILNKLHHADMLSMLLSSTYENMLLIDAVVFYSTANVAVTFLEWIQINVKIENHRKLVSKDCLRNLEENKRGQELLRNHLLHFYSEEEVKNFFKH